jgi:hypothetical protein
MKGVETVEPHEISSTHCGGEGERGVFSLHEPAVTLKTTEAK